MNSKEIILKGLPKVSLNEIYAGSHWRKRKKIKDNYKMIINTQYKGVFCKSKVYVVNYIFVFKTRALDTSNTVYMLKMIEDILFEDDSYKIIPKLIIQSEKGKEDLVKIIIKEVV